MNKTPRIPRMRAFTLIELLTVMAIIALLMAIAIPAMQQALIQTKKLEARTDLIAITSAVRAYHTEYGRLPDNNLIGGVNGRINDNAALISALRGMEDAASRALNPKGIVFLEGRIAKETGAGASARRFSGVASDGRYYDPWGRQYQLALDHDYDNTIPNPYSDGAGPAVIRLLAIGWCTGVDGKGGSGTFRSGPAADDVISWQ